MNTNVKIKKSKFLFCVIAGHGTITQDATTANQTRPSLLSDILLLCKKHCQKQINKTKKSVDIYLCFFLRKLSFQVFKYHIYTYEHIILYIKKQEQRK